MSALPPLLALRAFDAVMRCGSLAGAARELGVTHGAISLQLKQLERAIARPLFQRDRRRLVPNGDALALQVSVQGAFDEIRAATHNLRAVQEPQRLRIACVPSLLSHWLLPRIGAFADLHPGVVLELVPENTPGILRDDRVDVALYYGMPPEDLWWQRLDQVRLFPVASPALLARRPLGQGDSLAGHVLLHGDDGREWHEWLAGAGQVRAPRNEYFLSNARIALEAAELGLGIALGDELTSATALAQRWLVVACNRAVIASGSFLQLCRHERRMEPMIHAFVSWVQQALPPLRRGDRP